MIWSLYSIRDQGAEVFERPFVARAHGEALRLFADLIEKKGTVHHVHREQFSLWHVGTFDDSSGCLEQLPEPHRLVGGGDFPKED